MENNMKDNPTVAEKSDENLADENHIRAYINLVSCKPFKKTSLPPLSLRYKTQKQKQTPIIELSPAEVTRYFRSM